MKPLADSSGPQRGELICDEWTEVSDQKANRRRLWWDCAIVGALLLAWFVFAKH